MTLLILILSLAACIGLFKTITAALDTYYEPVDDIDSFEETMEGMRRL